MAAWSAVRSAAGAAPVGPGWAEHLRHVRHPGEGRVDAIERGELRPAIGVGGQLHDDVERGERAGWEVFRQQAIALGGGGGLAEAGQEVVDLRRADVAERQHAQEERAPDDRHARPSPDKGGDPAPEAAPALLVGVSGVSRSFGAKGQKAARPSTASSAGTKVRPARSITATPSASVGPRPR